jgi:hypothetical protein
MLPDLHFSFFWGMLRFAELFGMVLRPEVTGGSSPGALR